jgi:hypothetical protein
MIRGITPNRAVLFAVFGFVFYWVLALFVPAAALRDVFNSLCFGTAVIIVLTWLPSALKALKENVDAAEWQLIIGIFLIWLIVAAHRIYAIAFNFAGRPDSWADSAITGFFPYSFMLGGLLFLTAPAVDDRRLGRRAIWAIVAAVAIGSFVAGALFMASISTGV